MKKVYEKPRVHIESFELSQHIAACENPIKDKNHAVSEGCSGNIPSLGVSAIFFTNLDYDVCATDGEDMYCYTGNNMDEGFVFSS